MIYQINNFDACQLTGFTDIEVSYNYGKGITTEKRSFTSEGNAIAYIRSEIKESIFSRYQDYIRSAKNLYDGGNGVHHTIGKDKAFKKLYSTINKLWDCDIEAMCKNIAHLRNELYQILPGEKHPYYNGLHNEALEICAFAKSNKEFRVENLMIMEVAA